MDHKQIFTSASARTAHFTDPRVTSGLCDNVALSRLEPIAPKHGNGNCPQCVDAPRCFNESTDEPHNPLLHIGSFRNRGPGFSVIGKLKMQWTTIMRGHSEASEKRKLTRSNSAEPPALLKTSAQRQSSDEIFNRTGSNCSQMNILSLTVDDQQ
jgi:hypothetical protein